MSITAKPRGNVILSESKSEDYTFPVPVTDSGDVREGLSLSVSNDGASSLTIEVNGLTITVLAGEVFDDDFEPFTSVTVTSSVAYRIIIRG